MTRFFFKKQQSLRYIKIYLIDHAFTTVGGSGNSPNMGRLIENLVFPELINRRKELNLKGKTIMVKSVLIWLQHIISDCAPIPFLWKATGRGVNLLRIVSGGGKTQPMNPISIYLKKSEKGVNLLRIDLHPAPGFFKKDNWTFHIEY